MTVLFAYRRRGDSVSPVADSDRRMFPAMVAALWFVLAWLGGGDCLAASEPGAIVPPRQVEQLQKDVPEWKRAWDTARRMVLAGDYPAAAAVYEALLAQRPGLDEARWELARTYIRMQAWPKAVVLLERLLDGSPDRIEYLNALAQVMVAQKHWGRAVELFARVLEKSPGEAAAVEGMAAALLVLDRQAEALPYLERAYRQSPDDNRRRQALADLAYRLGEYEIARPQLVALATAADASSELLLRAARVHDKLGQQNLAATYWQRLVERMPNHLEGHQRLAAFHEQGSRFGEALKHLLVLNRLAPSDTSLWLRIGKALVVISRGKEALTYLDRYVAAVPDDLAALELLVNIYARQGEQAAAAVRLDRFLAGQALPDTGRVKQAARLYEAADRLEDAVAAYHRYFSLGGVDPDAVFAMAADLRKLGVRGRFDAVVRFADAGSPSTAIGPERYRLMIAAAFAGGGWWDRAGAEYEALAGGDAPIARQALLGLSDIYLEMGLFYEAEQALRRALALGGDAGPFLLSLFDLALRAGKVEDAEIWQQRFAALGTGAVQSWRAQFIYARLLAAKGEYGLAIRNCRRLLTTVASSRDAAAVAMRGEIGLALVDFLLASGDQISALRQLEGMPVAQVSGLGAQVLRQDLYQHLERPKDADQFYQAALSEADAQDEGLLRLADLYRRRGMVDALGKVAQLIRKRLPDSPRALLLVAAAYRAAGQDDAAEAVLVGLLDHSHGESGAAVVLLQLLFDGGRFAEALACAERLPVTPGARPEALLLKARALWALERRVEAVKVYEAFLTPSAADRMDGEIREQGIACPPLVEPPSIWQIVTLHGEEPAGFIDTLMSPAHVATLVKDPVQQRLGGIAARYYALYRWQKRFYPEYAARRAVQRKEFFYAVQQYQVALREEPDSPSLLYDLAGVYSRLGQLGEEAGIYERMAARRIDFPGLNEARQRNGLKLRPLTSVSLGYLEEDGRDGYKDMRRDWQEAATRYRPFGLSGHELDIALSRRQYRSMAGSAKMRANRGLLSYTALLTPWLSGRFGVGAESPAEDSVAQTGLLQGGLTGKIGDKVRADLSFDRDLVTDTLASVTRNVRRETFKGGVSLDLLPRLQVGGDCSFVDLSDGNAIRGYDFWGSYLLLTEPHSLRVRYVYDFKDSREGRIAGPLTADGFAAADHPYWTPMNYWLNRFVVSYRRQLSEEILDRGGPTYYTAEYSLDYDSLGRQFQTIGGGILYEWSSHFLMEATATLTSSDLYRRKEISLSLVYRW